MTDSKKYTKCEKMAKEYDSRDAKYREYLDGQQTILTAKNDVQRVIYTHISKWIGRDVNPSQPIPNVRERSFGDRQPDFFEIGIYVADIMMTLHVYKTPTLKSQLSALKNIKESAEKMRKEIENLDSELMTMAMNAARNLQPCLEGRMVAAIGADNAAYMGLEVIAVGVSQQIAYLEKEIEQRPHKKGRAKNEAAHKAALEAARLYAKVTGKKPTYSENQDGISGAYTPFLRDIFDTFGWKRLNLKLPAQTAIDALTAEDYKLDLIPHYPSI